MDFTCFLPTCHNNNTAAHIKGKLSLNVLSHERKGKAILSQGEMGKILEIIRLFNL
jgi:hypothetical protein